MKTTRQHPPSPNHPSLIQTSLILDQLPPLVELPESTRQKCVQLLVELLLAVAKNPVQEGGRDEQ